MVEARTTTNYIKPNMEIYGKALDAYLNSVAQGGKSPHSMNTCKRHIRAFLARCPPMQPHEITAEVLADVSIILKNDGLTAISVTEALIHTGRFLQFITGSNPYSQLDPNSRVQWYAGHMGEFLFQNQLDSYLEFLHRTKLSLNSIRQKRIHITICCRVLSKEKGILFISQIDESCFWYLDQLMSNLNKAVSSKILFDLNEFIRWYCGNEILKHFRQRRKPIKEYIDSPEYVEFMDLVRGYRIDMEERGLRPRSIQSTTNMISEGFAILCQTFGPIPPESINYHHIRALRSCITGLKQNTVKLYLSNLGRMLEFYFGSNPYRNAGLRWSSEQPSRTWITQRDWSVLWSSADIEERVVLALAGGMGLRRAEIADLRIEDISETLTISGKGHGVDGKIVEKPIPKTVRTILDKYIRTVRADITGEPNPTSGSLLVQSAKKSGSSCSVRHVEVILGRLSSKTGIKFTAHTLRRYYCTSLYDAGIDLDTLRRMMRHENLNTTLTCYLNADPRKIDAATEIVQQAIFG